MVYTAGSLRDVTLPSVRPFDMCVGVFWVKYCHQSSNNNCRNVHFGRLEKVAILGQKSLKKLIGRIDEMDVVTGTTGAHSLRCQSTIGFGIGLSLYRHNIVIEPYGSFYLQRRNRKEKKNKPIGG